jgi:RHS repeat-associated protein
LNNPSPKIKLSSAMRYINTLLAFLLFASTSITAQNYAHPCSAKWTGANWQTALGNPTYYPRIDAVVVDASVYNGASYAVEAGSVKNFVQLRVDLKSENSLIFNKRFKVETNVDISFPDNASANCGGSPCMNIILGVEYNPAAATTFKDRDVFQVPIPAGQSAYKMNLKLNSAKVFKWNGTAYVEMLSGDPDLISANNYLSWYLDAWVEMEQYRKIVTTPTIPQISAATITNNQIDLTWGAVTNAVEYDLEWIYIDDYGTTDLTTFTSASLLKYNFRKNSNRVRVSTNTYSIPLVFEHGYVAFRVRSIGRNSSNLADLSKPVFSDWSVPISSTSGTVNNLAEIGLNIQKIKVINGDVHQQDLLNWQMVASYFEDGNRKDLVSYFDGTMRGRQSVTKTYEYNTTIVSDQLYDFEGRPSVQLMPAPINATALQFYPNLNGTSAAQFNRSIFNTYTSCALNSGAITNNTGVLQGSGQYYSASNFSLNTATPSVSVAYLPDAEGYPYTQVEYTHDNTGRVRRQGGAGTNHKIGSGHDTRYYYGVPAQIELDRLFGGEVGDANHYKKNMVIDANGQASISYLDLKGNVIATALAGDAPVGLDSVRKIELLPIVEDLLDFNIIDSVNHALITQKSLLVPAAASYNFSYSVTPETFSINYCNEALPAPCYDCVYELNIRITKDEDCAPACGGTLPNINQTINSPYTNATPPVVDVTCSVTLQNVAVGNFTLQPGSYTITKILKVSDSGLDAYMTDFLKNQCNEYTEFLNQEIAEISLSDCDIICPHCQDELTALGTDISTVSNTALENLQNCVDAAACDATQTNMCDVALAMMLDDVSPGGQYAEFHPDTISGGVEIALNADDFPLSLLNKTTTNKFPPYNVTSVKNFSNPSLNYLDEDGTTISMIIASDGTSKTPNNLSLREFLDNWRPSWANELIKLHPEYPQYKWCIDKALAGYNYDESMNQATTMSLASASGLLNLMNAPLIDPYFLDPMNSGTRIPSLIAAFKHQHKQTNSPCTPSNPNFPFHRTDKCPTNINTAYINDYLKWAAVAIVHCTGGNPLGCPFINANSQVDLAFGLGTIDQRNQKWQLYRAFYRSIKSEVMYFERTKESLANAAPYGNSYNGCIGVAPDAFKKTINKFSPDNNVNEQPCQCSSSGDFSTATDNAYRFRNKRRVFPAPDDIPALGNDNMLYEEQGDVGNPANSLSFLFLKLKTQMRDSLIRSLCGPCDVPAPLILPPIIEGFNGQLFKSDCEKPVQKYDITGLDIADPLVLEAWQPMTVKFCDTSNVMFIDHNDVLVENGIKAACVIVKPAISSATGKPFSWNDIQKVCCISKVDAEKIIWHKKYGYFDPAKEYYIFDVSVANPADPNNTTQETFEMSMAILPPPPTPSITPTFCTPLKDSCRWVGVQNAQYVNFKLYIEKSNNGIPAQDILFVYPNAEKSLCKECVTDPEPLYNPCKDELMAQAKYSADYRYAVYLDSIKSIVKNMYYAKCMKAVEAFTVSYNYALYHHTLYYYDQANNLVKTVPPNGIDYYLYGQTNLVTAQLAAIRQNRKTNHYPKPITTSTYKPNHKYPTFYKYNTINQPIQQVSPDGGATRFVYDEMRRLIRSHNANQSNTKYSYTKYDPLNRVIEVGEAALPPLMSLDITISAITYSSFLSALGTYSTMDAESQITRTIYDAPFSTATNAYFGVAGQENLRGRVSCVRYSPADNATFEQMTHYSYDVHGNVKTLIQDHSAFGQKRMDYTYDLISGNVKAFFFQKGKWDQYVHYYKYDKDNRLKKVETAQFPTAYSEMRDLDAEYFYYLHGPLARVELGDLKVQGVDYAYTIDGWLKGVNSGTLVDVTSDIGKDGSFVAGNFNKSLPRDAFGFVLGYYNNDYTKIGASATNFDNTNAQIMFPTYGVQLFNGNIPQMVTSTRVPDSIGYRGQLCSYKYDQLHRLKSQTSTLMNGVMTAWPAPSLATNHYWMDLTYDYAGNIKTLNRQGLNPTATRPMDQLQYKYTDAAKPNKLTYVDDLQTDAARYTDDMDDQNAGNYIYDNIGNMTTDASEGNKTIVWNVYNKITQVNITTPAVTMTFGYDATGNRVRKTVTKSSITTDQWYLRDAQGNTLAVYKKVGTAIIQQDVVYLYGSSRLGELVVQRAVPKIWDNRYARIKGNRHYELSNHLGNVLSVVTDRRLAKEPTASNAPTYYLPDVYMVENYYAFGQPLPKWNSKTTDAPFYDPTKYRYGFNGKEDDDEWSKQDYGFRIYDGRIGRFLSVDPLTKDYPWYTPYQVSGNMPITSVDVDGAEPTPAFKPEKGVGYAVNVTVDGNYKAEYVKLLATKNIVLGMNIVVPDPSGKNTYLIENQYFQGCLRIDACVVSTLLGRQQFNPKMSDMQLLKNREIGLLEQPDRHIDFSKFLRINTIQNPAARRPFRANGFFPINATGDPTHRANSTPSLGTYIPNTGAIDLRRINRLMVSAENTDPAITAFNVTINFDVDAVPTSSPTSTGGTWNPQQGAISDMRQILPQIQNILSRNLNARVIVRLNVISDGIKDNNVSNMQIRAN